MRAAPRCAGGVQKSCDKHGIRLALYFSEATGPGPAVDGQGGNGGGSNPGTADAVRSVNSGSTTPWARRLEPPGDGRVVQVLPAAAASSASITATSRVPISDSANWAVPAR